MFREKGEKRYGSIGVVCKLFRQIYCYFVYELHLLKFIFIRLNFDSILNIINFTIEFQCRNPTVNIEINTEPLQITIGTYYE